MNRHATPPPDRIAASALVVGPWRWFVAPTGAEVSSVGRKVLGSLAAVVMCRRLVVLALAVVVLALVTGWARGEQTATAAVSEPAIVDVAGDALPAIDRTPAGTEIANRTSTAATGGWASPLADLGDRQADDRPCVLRANCAGALVLGGLGLVLALPAMAPVIGGLVPATPLVAVVPTWRPSLRSGRLFRPPRTS